VLFTDPEFKNICKDQCHSEFLSAVKVGPTTEKMAESKCGAVSDCYDCNAMDSCMWCSGSCRTITSCPAKVLKKDKTTLRDYLLLYESCPPLPICGAPGPFSEKSKEIMITNETLKKNTVCSWKVAFKEKMTDTSLIFSLQDFYPENYTSYVNYHLFHCYQKLGEKSCKFETLKIGNDKPVYNLHSFEFEIYMVVKQDILMNGTHLKISYNSKSAVDDYDMVLFIIGWIMAFIFICAALYASLSACKRVAAGFRRFKMLRQQHRRGRHEELPDENTHSSLEGSNFQLEQYGDESEA